MAFGFRRHGLTKAFYSPAEVAHIAGLHPDTILNYIHSGRLTAAKLSPRTYRIPLRAVAKLLYPDEIDRPEIIERPHGGSQAAATLRRRLRAEHERRRVRA